MKFLIYSATSFALAMLVTPTLSAAPLKRYVWSDSAGLISADSATNCQTRTEEFTPIYISQKPGASLNAVSKLKALTFFKGLNPSNLLDRAILIVKELPADQKPATVQVVSIPKNATQHPGLTNVSARNDVGTMEKAALQEVGNFVIEVIKAPPTVEAQPLPLNKSYWQAALENEKYISLVCENGTVTTAYTIFDVYDSKGIDPIAQVGIAQTDTRILEEINVLTPDEANQEAIGEEVATPDANGTATQAPQTPSVSTPTTPAMVAKMKKSNHQQKMPLQQALAI